MFIKQSGFTLVELSIVLVVIGLLLSGIVKAQALIENAQIRADIKKLNEFKMITLLYRDRLATFPGEDASNPGRIKTVLSSEPSPTEGYFFDIYQAGFSQRVNPLPEIGTAFKATWGGSSGANYGLIAGVNQICITEIDVDLAQSIESQMDEGERAKGEVEYTLNGSQLCAKL